jgi:hypothetical protein
VPNLTPSASPPRLPLSAWLLRLPTLRFAAPPPTLRVATPPPPLRFPRESGGPGLAPVPRGRAIRRGRPMEGAPTPARFRSGPTPWVPASAGKAENGTSRPPTKSPQCMLNPKRRSLSPLPPRKRGPRPCSSSAMARDPVRAATERCAHSGEVPFWPHSLGPRFRGESGEWDFAPPGGSLLSASRITNADPTLRFPRESGGPVTTAIAERHAPADTGSPPARGNGCGGCVRSGTFPVIDTRTAHAPPGNHPQEARRPAAHP